MQTALATAPNSTCYKLDIIGSIILHLDVVSIKQTPNMCLHLVEIEMSEG